MLSEEVILEPTQLFVEISEADKNRVWKQTEASATPVSRWNAYLNQVALEALLPLLQEEDSKAKVGHGSNALASFWELFNGTSIDLDGKRLLLVPSETTDLGELRVPQEWVDISNLAADYYLAVQVNLDDNYVRVWGYCTHLQLKKAPNYQAGDRSYTLAEDELIGDLSVLWLAREFCPNEVTQAEVTPVAPLSAEQAKNLIERLSNAELLIPRMTIPFQYWAAIVADDNTRQRLTNKRRGQIDRSSVVDWFKAKKKENK